MNKETKTIKVDYMARVEGEGALYIKIKNNAVADVKLNIFEPPRFFEAFLRERSCFEAPDITARICGICPIAYQMSSVHAIESAMGITTNETIRALRRLIYCGEWIESHTLHIYMLHAPDFLGYQDAIQIAKDYPEVVKQGLRLKKAGNSIVSLLGGREIHPINVCVGGFYKCPTKRQLNELAEELKWALEAAVNTVQWTSTFSFPDFEQDYEFVALRHPDEYPFNEGRIASNKGLDIHVSEFENYFTEEHVHHSNALHSRLMNKAPYFVGPLARYNVNFDKLSPLAQEIAHKAGLSSKCLNPFKSIIVRGIELVQVCEEAIQIIESYEEPKQPTVPVKLRAGTGHGCTEAPRGSLYHRYQIDENGLIKDAVIIPPTSQNQKIIEKDLLDFVSPRLNLSEEKMTWQCEQLVRNYDPCISCATHFLKVRLET